jgi:D-inositol-3-phosphate glycosyltransferase
MDNRLAYFCSSQSWGGLEMNHLHNAVWMRERGHNVIVLGIASSPFHVHALEFGLPFHPILPHRRWYDFKAVRRLKKIIDHEKITHFIVRMVGDQSIAAGIKFKCKGQLHVSYFMEMQLGIRKKSIFHTLRYRYIDLWSCPLHWLKTQVEERTTYRNRLLVIPSGVDLERFANTPSRKEERKKLGVPENVTVFGMVGRFDPKKGQVLLIKAMNGRNNPQRGFRLPTGSQGIHR